MVQPQEHGDSDLFVVLVDLDVVKSVDDPVDELDSERLIVGIDVDPVPANQAWVSARRVRDGWVAAERPTVPKADEHPQVDDLLRDPEHRAVSSTTQSKDASSGASMNATRRSSAGTSQTSTSRAPSV
jgi:hypothetical protein